MASDFIQFGAAGAVVAVVMLFLKFMREDGANRDRTYTSVAEALRSLSKATDRNSNVLERHLTATKKTTSALKKISDNGIIGE